MKTTRRTEDSVRPVDRVQRVFTAERPNALWVSDLTDVAAGFGFRQVAFVSAVYARRMGGGWGSPSRRTAVALEALEQARYARRRGRVEALIHHRERGVHYSSLRYPERLAQAGIEPAVGSVGDSYEKALAESVIGWYKMELIGQRGPWHPREAVEFATLAGVDGFNHRRLLALIGYRPPAEGEADYLEQASAIGA